MMMNMNFFLSILTYTFFSSQTLWKRLNKAKIELHPFCRDHVICGEWNKYIVFAKSYCRVNVGKQSAFYGCLCSITYILIILRAKNFLFIPRKRKINSASTHIKKTIFNFSNSWVISSMKWDISNVRFMSNVGKPNAKQKAWWHSERFNEEQAKISMNNEFTYSCLQISVKI